MAKEQIHDVAEAKGDQAIVMKHAVHAMQQIQEGHYKIINPSQKTLSPGVVRITFDRVETNRNEPASPASV